MRVTNLGHYLKDNEKSPEGFEQGTDIIRLALEKDTRVTSLLCATARMQISTLEDNVAGKYSYQAFIKHLWFAMHCFKPESYTDRMWLLTVKSIYEIINSLP